MKYKVGDKVRFVKDCALGTGEVIIPDNSTWIVREVRESHYLLERTDEHLVAMVGHGLVDDYCERINTEPSITKRINNKHDILNGLFNSDGSIDGEKLIKKLDSAVGDDYYEKSAMQPLEVSQVLLTKEQFAGALLFNIIKYRMRKKGQDESDAFKARQYAYWLEMVKQGKKINPSVDVVPDDYTFDLLSIKES
jgi:hypothetical protein